MTAGTDSLRIPCKAFPALAIPRPSPCLTPVTPLSTACFQDGGTPPLQALYSQEIPRMAAIDKLQPHGITLEEARSFITQNISNPGTIYEASVRLKLNSADLAEITGLTEKDVTDYIIDTGHDILKLNQQRTDTFLLSELGSGDVFDYNPLTGAGKQVFSFGTSVTDIASHFSGNVFAVSFDGLYRYDLNTQTVNRIADVSTGTNSLAIKGNTLYTASTADSVVRVYDLNGHELAAHTLPGGRAAGDISIIGDQLFRTTTTGIYRTDMNTGATTLEAGEIAAKYHGLAQSADGLLAGFGNDGEVKGYNPATGQVIDNLPDVKLTGLSDISGATEALTSQIAAWA